jgi:hypothetical protein
LFSYIAFSHDDSGRYLTINAVGLDVSSAPQYLNDNSDGYFVRLIDLIPLKEIKNLNNNVHLTVTWPGPDGVHSTRHYPLLQVLLFRQALTVDWMYLLKVETMRYGRFLGTVLNGINGSLLVDLVVEC